MTSSAVSRWFSNLAAGSSAASGISAGASAAQGAANSRKSSVATARARLTPSKQQGVAKEEPSSSEASMAEAPIPLTARQMFGEAAVRLAQNGTPQNCTRQQQRGSKHKSPTITLLTPNTKCTNRIPTPSSPVPSVKNANGSSTPLALQGGKKLAHGTARGTRPLSAQSTLESLGLLNNGAAAALANKGSAAAAAAAHHQHTGKNNCSNRVKSPSSSTAAGMTTSNHAMIASSLSSQGGECGSPLVGADAYGASAAAVQQENNSSLAALFACVSPYLSTADVRSATPFRRLYDPRGPVVFAVPPLSGVRSQRGELRLWSVECERVISQNSSNRRVHRSLWTSNADPTCPRPAALKFVEDGNPRDGRSLKREIECHIFVYQKLPTLFQYDSELRNSQLGIYSFTRSPQWAVAERLEDSWPSAELFGYHLDKKNPGKSVLLTRKLSGPDLFDVIRAEHNHNWHFHHPSDHLNPVSPNKCRTVYAHRAPAKIQARQNGVLHAAATFSNTESGSGNSCAYYPANYEYHKLRWCAIALKRLCQYATLSIRHNDVKPDNIVLDFYETRTGQKSLDVKLIDLGTASMNNAKDFTGGTSWYESPEQKLLEYFMKKRKDPEAAKRVEIDLPSDLWGAGISLAEVLIGKRVVDSLKPPNGPGSLEYIGYDSYTQRSQGRTSSGILGDESDALNGGGHVENYPYWALDPSDWLGLARKALGLDNSRNKISNEAARWIFDHLVRPCPESRTSLHAAMNRLERFAEEAYRRYRHTTNSFDEHSSQTSNDPANNFIVPEPSPIYHH